VYATLYITSRLLNVGEVCWALSSSESFSDDDPNFHSDDFYYNIIELLDEEAPTRNHAEEFDKSWAETTLSWWEA